MHIIVLTSLQIQRITVSQATVTSIVNYDSDVLDTSIANIYLEALLCKVMDMTQYE